MKKLGPAYPAFKKDTPCDWIAERKSEPENTPALRVVSTVVAHSAAATFALENTFTVSHLGIDHPDRSAAAKELFRVHHRRYRFSGQQLCTLRHQKSRSKPTTLST